MAILTNMRQIKDLSPSERHVVEYIFDHMSEVSNMGIVELGEKAFTSTTTVKRLCKKLGIDSYTDFRIQLAAELSSYAHQHILNTAKNPVDKYDSVGDILTKVSNQNAKSVIDTSLLNDTKAIEDVVKAMHQAKRIDFYGAGPSNMVAVDAQIKCMRLGIPSSAHSDRVSMLTNAKAYSEGTLAFLISYTGRNRDIVEIAQELQLIHVPAVSITSFSGSTLAELCKFSLYVDASESWNRLGGMSSRISTLNMIDVLFTALINLDYDKYDKNIKSTCITNSIELEE